MSYDPVATRYAQAVFEVAKDQGRVEETLELLKLIGSLLKEHPELRDLLQQPGDCRPRFDLFRFVIDGDLQRENPRPVLYYFLRVA